MRLSAISLTLFILAAHSLAAQPRDVRQVYTEFCSSCHGQNLRGGTASNLLVPGPLGADDDERLAAIIRLGTGDGGMPAFAPQRLGNPGAGGLSE
jgi:mono/diheme cytochrome c family protein